MKKTITHIALIFSFVFFTSCEGGTTFIKTIENNTKETIQFSIFTIYGNTNSSQIKPGESKEVLFDDQIGFFVDETYTCIDLIDSFSITFTNEKELIKDFMNPVNWIRESSGGRNSKENCKFIIDENDIK